MHNFEDVKTIKYLDFDKLNHIINILLEEKNSINDYKELTDSIFKKYPLFLRDDFCTSKDLYLNMNIAKIKLLSPKDINIYFNNHFKYDNDLNLALLKRLRMMYLYYKKYEIIYEIRF